MSIKLLDRLSGKQKAVLIIIFITPILLIDVLDYFARPMFRSESDREGIDLHIPRGAYLDQIADSLYNKKLIEDRDIFVFWAKTLGYETRLRAGHYTIPRGLNYYQLVNYLSEARETTQAVTFPEGWTYRRMAERAAAQLGISSGQFDSLCADEAFIAEFGLDVPTLEGYLLPNTYFFSRATDARSVIGYMVEQTLAIFDEDEIKQAMKKSGFSRDEILTLASIVEGEAIVDEERPVIASVYLNRLRKGMRLQADPTIQYIISGPPRRLLNRDLEIDSPYNTYKYAGLPPGPINNPGEASIRAVLFPAQTSYLYMVAVGDGSHEFSRTFKEHLKAKAAFDKVRRELRRKNNPNN